ncbi:MAG TPA: DAK2 domain-containing protein, partial [Candidatus Limnocylindrales bacterium]
MDGREEIRAYVRRVASAVGRHEALLNRLDAALGDGDHGENMVTGWRAVLTAVEDEPSDDLGDILRRIGTTLVASVGGASGPLYGTAFIEAGFALKGRLSIDLAALATAFEVGARGLARRGRCAVGDKTILDALAPAAAALRTAADAGEPIGVALEKATRAAVAGMRS